MTTVRLLHQVSVLLGTIALTAGLAANASAQGRSRVSADLAWKLVADDGKPTRVIITGSQSTVNELAARHNLRIYRRLPTGAAVEVPAGRLGLLAEDAVIDTLSSDQTVRSHMSVTNASIGADLVHAGVAGAPGLTGAGIGGIPVGRHNARHVGAMAELVLPVRLLLGEVDARDDLAA